MSEDSMAELHEGILLRVTLPLLGGSHFTLDGAVEMTGEELVVCLQVDHQTCLTLSPDTSWVLTRDFNDTILLYRARLKKKISDRRFALQVESVAQHTATRKSCRVEAQVQIREWAGGTAWSRLRKANTRQVTLSTTGIRFLTNDRFRPGQKLGMEITLPGQHLKTIQTSGEVIHSSQKDLAQHEVAVVFTDMSQENIDIIETFFITHHFRTMHNRVKLLGEVLSPSLDPPDDKSN